MIDVTREQAIGPSEAAAMLGVTAKTICRYFDAEQTQPPLESFRLNGRHRRTTREAVQRFVAARQQQEPGSPPIFAANHDYVQDNDSLRQTHGI